MSYVRPMPWKFWLITAACAAGPDLDVGLHSYGVEYGDLWGHRGMTHSLFFALIIGVLVTSWFFRKEAKLFSWRWLRLATFFTIATASQGFLDAMTDGGLGVAFFAPFDETRYFFPWTPIPVANFGIRSLFTEYGAYMLLGELSLVWLPSIFVCGSIAFVKRYFIRKTHGDIEPWVTFDQPSFRRSDASKPD